MTNFDIFTYIVTTLSISGSILNSRQNRWGFVVWGIANMCWIGVDLSRDIYAQAFLYTVFIGLNIYGWINWTNSKE